jgi:hypothetical protein
MILLPESSSCNLSKTACACLRVRFVRAAFSYSSASICAFFRFVSFVVIRRCRPLWSRKQAVKYWDCGCRQTLAICNNTYNNIRGRPRLFVLFHWPADALEKDIRGHGGTKLGRIRGSNPLGSMYLKINRHFRRRLSFCFRDQRRFQASRNRLQAPLLQVRHNIRLTEPVALLTATRGGPYRPFRAVCSRQFIELLARAGLREKESHRSRDIGRSSRREAGVLSFIACAERQQPLRLKKARRIRRDRACGASSTTKRNDQEGHAKKLMKTGRHRRRIDRSEWQAGGEIGFERKRGVAFAG